MTLCNGDPVHAFDECANRLIRLLQDPPFLRYVVVTLAGFLLKEGLPPRNGGDMSGRLDMGSFSSNVWKEACLTARVTLGVKLHTGSVCWTTHVLGHLTCRNDMSADAGGQCLAEEGSCRGLGLPHLSLDPALDRALQMGLKI